MNKKILIMGLPGSGKTTLARELATRLNAVHFDADEMRAQINKDLGFSLADRIEQARRMGWLCDRVVESGAYAIANFVCPTEETRAAFGPAFIIWVDRIAESRFPDTNLLFVAPSRFDIRATAGTSQYWIDPILKTLEPTSQEAPAANSPDQLAQFRNSLKPTNDKRSRVFLSRRNH